MYIYVREERGRKERKREGGKRDSERGRERERESERHTLVNSSSSIPAGFEIVERTGCVSSSSNLTAESLRGSDSYFRAYSLRFEEKKKIGKGE